MRYAGNPFGLITLLVKRITFAKKREREFWLRFFNLFPFVVKRSIIQQFVSYRKKQLDSLEGPSNLFYFVTNRCNMNCKHCFYKSEINKGCEELLLEEIEKIANSLRKSLSSVSVTGGEPLLRKDLAEICMAFYNYVHVTVIAIATNGYFPERTTNLVRYLLNNTDIDISVRVSLDGPLEVHNEIRRTKKAFENATRTIRELQTISKKNKRFDVVINTVISKRNSNVIVDFYKYVKNNFDVNSSFHFLRQDGFDVMGLSRDVLLDADTSHNSLPDIMKCEEIIKQIKEIEGNNLSSRWGSKVKEYQLKILEERRPVVKCTGYKTNTVLFPDGGVSLCEVVKPFDNIRNYNYDFIDCWNLDLAKRQRVLLRNCSCTYPSYLMESMMYDVDTLMSIFNPK